MHASDASDGPRRHEEEVICTPRGRRRRHTRREEPLCQMARADTAARPRRVAASQVIAVLTQKPEVSAVQRIVSRPRRALRRKMGPRGFQHGPRRHLRGPRRVKMSSRRFLDGQWRHREVSAAPPRWPVAPPEVSAVPLRWPVAPPRSLRSATSELRTPRNLVARASAELPTGAWEPSERASELPNDA